MPKAKPYGRRNTKHGAESVTKSFSRPQSPRSVQYHDEKNRLHYNRFVITTKRMLDEIEKNRGFNNKGFVEKRLGGYKQKGRLKNLSDGLLLLNFVSDCTTERNRS